MIIIGTITQTNVYRLIFCIDIINNNIKIINITKICFHAYLMYQGIYFNASLMQVTCNLHIFLIIPFNYGLIMV